MRSKMFDIEIWSNIEAISKQVPRAFRYHIPAATSAALNRGIQQGATLTRRETAKRLGLSQKALQQTEARIRTKRSTPQTLEASIKLRGRRPPNVIRFSSDGAVQTAQGVRHGAWQPGRRKQLAKGAFLMPKSGKGKGKPAGRSTGARPGGATSQRKRPAKRARFSATVATHFVAKKRGGRIRGLFGGWPAREFLGHKSGQTSGVVDRVVELTNRVVPQRFIHEMRRRMGLIGASVPKAKRLRK